MLVTVWLAGYQSGSSEIAPICPRSVNDAIAQSSIYWVQGYRHGFHILEISCWAIGSSWSGHAFQSTNQLQVWSRSHSKAHCHSSIYLVILLLLLRLPAVFTTLHLLQESPCLRP